MADDLDEAEVDADAKPKAIGSGNLLMIVMIVLLLLFLVGAGLGGYFLVSQLQVSNQMALAAVQTTATSGQLVKEGQGVEGEADDEEEGDVDEDEVVETRDPIFIPMRPALIVNFPDDGDIRYLQLTLDFKAYDSAVVSALDTYKPVIRNNLVILLSNKGYDDLVSAKGKEKIRDEITEAVQEILEEAIGTPGIDSVYFTEFVIQ
jgi:flagellar protein FliL